MRMHMSRFCYVHTGRLQCNIARKCPSRRTRLRAGTLDAADSIWLLPDGFCCFVCHVAITSPLSKQWTSVVAATSAVAAWDTLSVVYLIELMRSVGARRERRVVR